MVQTLSFRARLVPSLQLLPSVLVHVLYCSQVMQWSSRFNIDIVIVYLMWFVHLAGFMVDPRYLASSLSSVIAQ